MPARVFAAVDIGASSGRVVRAEVDDEHVDIETVHRFPNAIVERDGHLRWPFTSLFDEVRAGLAKVPDAESIGIDTWGVDYGLLDDSGDLLAEPISYRDPRTSSAMARVHALISPHDMYAITGIQQLPINTIYQLAVDDQLERARHAVLLPDLVAYWLTGELRSEVTNASTTSLLDARTQQWSTDVLVRLGIADDLLPPIVSPGTARGTTPRGVAVTTVGSHDTASAVVGVPATTDRFAYVSSGTWSLVGVELTAPVLTDAARDASFTNEVGVDGRIRFLRNVAGLWLLQECLREWGRDDVSDLIDGAARLAPGGPRIDVDDPAFITPGRMPERIASAVGQRSLSPEAITRCIVDSLAATLATNVHRASELSGRAVDVIHIVGGGSQNELLCQLTATEAQLPVLAGPTEATALGNVLVQARAHGAVPASLEELRSRVAASTAIRRYEPA